MRPFKARKVFQSSVPHKFEYFVDKLKRYLVAQRYSSETVSTVAPLYHMEAMIQNHGIMVAED